MKEHKSELQQRVITLEHALNQARYELSERAVEVSDIVALLKDGFWAPKSHLLNLKLNFIIYICIYIDIYYYKIACPRY